MPSLDKDWASQETQSMTDKFRGRLKSQGALKPRIQKAVAQLQAQTARLDQMLAKLNERDSRLFQRVVAAVQQHDTATSKALSNELAEIRKVKSKMTYAKMMLERVQLRLTTVHDLGDAMVSLGPAVATMKELNPSLHKFMPNVGGELSSITEVLNGVTGGSVLDEETFIPDGSAENEEINVILKEATTVAGSQLETKFPDAPQPIGTESEQTSTYE